MSLINIDTLGYGKIYKTIMRNKTLPAIAKAIYAYICAYAGNRSKAFPKRDRIIRDLQINKDTFTKHLHTLVEGGYLAKERTSHGNLYTIAQSVSAFDIAPVESTNMSDRLVFENIQAKGFGTVPKLMLFDTRLSAQAKAIYAYFSSFAGAGTAAFPRQTTIMRDMKMSKDIYYNHFNQLINNGYITVEYRKDNGKFTHSIYRLHSEVEIPQGVQSEKSGHGGKPLKTSSATSEIFGTEKAVSEKPGSDNLGQANIKNSSISNISFEKEQKVDNHQERAEAVNTPHPTVNLRWVKEQINYSSLVKEVEALSNLKQMLGHFSSAEDRMRFAHVTNQMLEAIPVSILEQTLKCGATQCAALFTDEAVALCLLQDLSDQWENVRDVKKYVKAAVRNLLTCGEVNTGFGDMAY